MSGADWILKHGFPIAGLFTSLAIFLSPLKKVKDIRATGNVEDVNSYPKLIRFPFAMMTLNCMAWLHYGFFQKDIYLFLPNIAGLVLGIYYSISTYGYQDVRKRNITATLLIGGIGKIYFCSAMSFIYYYGTPIGNNILGTLCVVILVVFYSSPLTVIATVLKTRNSASILPGLTIANIVNGILWCLYGIIVADPVIFN